MIGACSRSRSSKGAYVLFGVQTRGRFRARVWDACPRRSDVRAYRHSTGRAGCGQGTPLIAGTRLPACRGAAIHATIPSGKDGVAARPAPITERIRGPYPQARAACGDILRPAMIHIEVIEIGVMPAPVAMIPPQTVRPAYAVMPAPIAPPRAPPGMPDRAIAEPEPDRPPAADAEIKAHAQAISDGRADPQAADPGPIAIPGAINDTPVRFHIRSQITGRVADVDRVRRGPVHVGIRYIVNRRCNGNGINRGRNGICQCSRGQWALRL